LGVVLQARNDLPGAIAAYRKALALNPESVEAHFCLGYALRNHGDLPAARGAFEKAIALKPAYAEAHCNLGLVLQRQGEFRKALAALRRGHELGVKGARWGYDSAQWVRACERLIELDGQLPAFLEGKTLPASAAERIELARLCALKRLHRAAARYYEGACAAQPLLLPPHAHDAAGQAALAGGGRGEDAAHLDDGQRECLRTQALRWLREGLTQWAKELDRKPAELRQVLLVLQRAPELAV